VVLVWLTSRTVGPPIGPEAGAAEAAAFVDVLATILEVAIVAGVALLVLRSGPTSSARGLRVPVGLAALVVLLAVLTTWSVAAGATSGGSEHGHGVDETAASAGGHGLGPVHLEESG
jgi:hypothetical protein